MRPFYLILVVMIISACSAPRYSYYFDQPAEPSGSATASLRLAPEELTGDATPATPVLAPEKASTIPKIQSALSSNPKTDRSARKAAKKELRAAIREFREVAKKEKSFAAGPAAVAQPKTNPKNNGFAIAGFVLSLVGWFVLWPLVILGIIFSAIGMNSERRGLAIAGLIIGIVGIILLLVASQNGGVV